MPTNVLEDRVLIRFRAGLDIAYGPRLERVVLFGSRARGDARPGSDYDVAVFLRDIIVSRKKLISWQRSKRLYSMIPGLSSMLCHFERVLTTIAPA